MDDGITEVAIVHSNCLFREALAIALAAQDGIAVTWDVAYLDHIEARLTASMPDLLLIEASLSLGPCFEQVAYLLSRAPRCKRIMLGVSNTNEAVLACIEQAGASGYVLETGTFGDVVTNIRAVAAGEAVCSPRITKLVFARMSALAHQVRASWNNQPDQLTRREREIVAAIEKGWSNKEIAVRLGIEVSTVKNHVHNILDKLQLHDRRSAAEYVKQQGLMITRH
jgi:DNA-binding NarL/FixJ family response regulator